MSFDRFWSSSEPVPGVPADSYQPTLAIVGEALHVVWSANRILYHAVRAGSKWSGPAKVAAGEQPSLIATSDGQLHCLFANAFADNWEIYHVRFDGVAWSLPQPVSRTGGASTQPSLAAARDGTLHAAWADTTPGESVIYHGTYSAGEVWSNGPVPSGRGCLPSVALTADGDVCVAWQDRRSQTLAFDVFCSVFRDGQWTVPDIVSDTVLTHSVQPWLVSNSQGAVHLIWLEEEGSLYAVKHADRRVNGWSRPVAVSTTPQDCRQARIVSNPQGFLQVVWLEGSSLHHRVRPPDYDATWWVPQTAEGSYRELSDLGVVVDQSGSLHVVWSGFESSGVRSLYYARREPIFKPAPAKPQQ